jgi:uncharacterized membrane protein
MQIKGRNSMWTTALIVALHTLAAIVWVGGAFFAYVALRPSIAPLEPPQRLALWRRTFDHFFPWVWIAVLALPMTGFALVIGTFGGFANVGSHIHIMNGFGMVMILLFVVLYGGPYKGFTDAIDKEDWPIAAAKLKTIRRIVAVNLTLGLITSAVGASGRFW